MKPPLPCYPNIMCNINPYNVVSENVMRSISLQSNKNWKLLNDELNVCRFTFIERLPILSFDGELPKERISVMGVRSEFWII